MKTSTVGLVLAAILMAVAGAGFGIAQAGGYHSDGPVLRFEDQEASGQAGSSSPYAEDRPVLSFRDEMQLRNPTETGSLPDESNTDSSSVGTEEHNYSVGEDIDDGSIRD